MVADELRRQADEFVDLTSLMPESDAIPPNGGCARRTARSAHASYAVNTQPVDFLARD